MRWSEKDLFEVELLEPLLDESTALRPRLPGQVTPLPGEALASWLLRYAEPFGLAPEDLLLRTAEAELAGGGDWCRRPHSVLIERLAQATGIDPTTIADMTLWSGDQASDDMRDRFSWSRFQAALPANGQRRRIAVCPRCLAEDETPYIRRDCTVGWATICPAHAVVLMALGAVLAQLLRAGPLSPLRIPSRNRFATRGPCCGDRHASATPASTLQRSLRASRTRTNPLAGRYGAF